MRHVIQDVQFQADVVRLQQQGLAVESAVEAVTANVARNAEWFRRRNDGPPGSDLRELVITDSRLAPELVAYFRIDSSDQATLMYLVVAIDDPEDPGTPW